MSDGAIRSAFSTRRVRVTAGALAIFFYAVAAGSYVARGRPENMLWSCHLGVLAVGIGLSRCDRRS